MSAMRSATLLVLTLVLLVPACGVSNTPSSPDADAASRRDGGHADTVRPLVDAPMLPVDSRVTGPREGGAADSGPFGCLGAALPISAPDPATLKGTTEEASSCGTAAVGLVALAAFTVTGTTPAATTTSSGTGAFTLPIPTGGAPFDGYIRAQSSSYLDSYLYPPAPIAASATGLPVVLLSSTTFGLLPLAAGASQPSGAGFISAAVVDCLGNPVAGATLTTVPAAMVRYDDSSGTPTSSASVTAADGIAYVFDLPAGGVTVGATYGGMTFRSHAVNARADVVTLTVVAP